MILGDQEVRLRHFHQTIDRFLTGARSPKCGRPATLRRNETNQARDRVSSTMNRDKAYLRPPPTG